MIKIGLVGCGRISKRHIEAINETVGVELAMVCDINEEKAIAAARTYNVPYTTDYKKIRDCDVISILTPSGLHPRHAVEVAEITNAQYIVCEKPISLTLKNAFWLYHNIEKKGKKLLPVYQNRYNPLIIFIKKLIDSGKLGTIYHTNTNIFWCRDDSYYNNGWHGTQEFDGGVLYTQASHYIDMLIWFFGNTQKINSIGDKYRGYEVCDTQTLLCKFQNNVISNLNVTNNVFNQNYQTEFTLISQNGTIRLSGTNLNRIDFWDVKDLEKPDLDFTIDHIYGKGHNTLYEYIANKKWDMFPSKENVLSGINIMELSSKWNN